MSNVIRRDQAVLVAPLLAVPVTAMSLTESHPRRTLCGHHPRPRLQIVAAAQEIVQ